MNRLARVLAIAVLASAPLSCSGDPTGFKAAEFEGLWVLSNPANSTCFGFAGASERYFRVDEVDPVDGSFNVVSEWDFENPDRYNWLVSGNFNLRERTVELNFWHTPLSVGSMFTGTINDDGSITGTLRDPKPGYSPHVVIGSCSWSATGSRMSP